MREMKFWPEIIEFDDGDEGWGVVTNCPCGKCSPRCLATMNPDLPDDFAAEWADIMAKGIQMQIDASRHGQGPQVVPGPRGEQ